MQVNINDEGISFVNTSGQTMEVSQTVRLANAHIECAHREGPAICPCCKKPCEQDLADFIQGHWSITLNTGADRG